MWFYYFRETKESDGYGTIEVARILSFYEPVSEYVRPQIKRYRFVVVIDKDDFELPAYRNRSRKFKESHPDYNYAWLPIEEGEIFNRTFWLREYDLKRAHEIVNNYYKEVTEKNSRIYSKRMNSKIEVKIMEEI